MLARLPSKRHPVVFGFPQKKHYILLVNKFQYYKNNKKTICFEFSMPFVAWVKK